MRGCECESGDAGVVGDGDGGRGDVWGICGRRRDEYGRRGVWDGCGHGDEWWRVRVSLPGDFLKKKKKYCRDGLVKIPATAFRKEKWRKRLLLCEYTHSFFFIPFATLD